MQITITEEETDKLPSTPPLAELFEDVNHLPPPRIKAPLSRTMSNRLDATEYLTNPALLSKEQILENAQNATAMVKAQKGDQNCRSGESTKGQSFYISETSFQNKSLSLEKKETPSSGMQPTLRRNFEKIDDERDDEGFPRDDDSTLDNYIFQEKQPVFKKDSDGFLIPNKPIPQKPPIISRPLEQKTNQNKSTCQPGKRERTQDTQTKKKPTMPPPKRQKTDPTPDQNPQKKPQGQRPTS